MEYSEKNWTNKQGVSVCEGINEIEYTPLGGELIIHGGLSVQNLYSNVAALSSSSIEVIHKRKKYEESTNPNYRILDNVQVGFEFNQDPNLWYGYPVSLIDFFNKNNVKHFDEVTPDMIVSWPNSKWNWSKEKIFITPKSLLSPSNWVNKGESQEFINNNLIKIVRYVSKENNCIMYDIETFTPCSWMNNHMKKKYIDLMNSNNVTLRKDWEDMYDTSPISCVDIADKSIDYLDEGKLRISIFEIEIMLQQSGLQSIEEITFELVVNHPNFFTICNKDYEDVMRLRYSRRYYKKKSQ